MSNPQEHHEALQLPLNVATVSSSTRSNNMSPKKLSPLDKIRAKASKNRAAQAVALRDSAWHQIDVRNAGMAPPRTIEKEFAPTEKTIKRSTVPSKEVDKPTKVTKSSPVPRQSPVVKRKASIAQVVKKEKLKPREELVSESEQSEPDTLPPTKQPKEEPESWVPAGGLILSDDNTTNNPPSQILGIARIPGWRIDKFSLALGELLLNLDVEDDFRIKVQTAEDIAAAGLENLTDVFVKFEGVEQAEAARRKVQGKLLGGRKLRVRFV